MLNSVGDQLPLVLELGLSRLAPVSTLAYMEAATLFVQMPSAETIANFRFSDEVQSRITTLLAKNKRDELTRADEVELDRLTQPEGQLQLVKAKALVSLHQKTADANAHKAGYTGNL